MISVIIPMYNSEGTIEKALDSIKRQSALNMIKEIIVVNDGSKDNSLKIVKEYCLRNEELSIKIIDKENGGVSTARNAGIRSAVGEYIALLDSDDQWKEDKIANQMDIMLKNKDIDLSATTFNGETFNRFLLKKFDYITQIKTIDLVFKNFFQPSTVIFKRKKIEEVGFFPEDQRYAEEGNFFLRFTNCSYCILINKSYLQFGSGIPGFEAGGLSGNLKEMQKGEIKNLKFAKKSKYINIFTYWAAFIFSYTKYLRRIIITNKR